MSRYWQAGGREFSAIERVYTPFSGYGEAAWTDMQKRELNYIMDNAVLSMRGAVSALENKIAQEARMDILLSLAGAWLASALFTSTDEARAGALSGLKTIKTIVARLDGPARQEVLAGTMAPEKWLGSSKVVLQGVKDQANILKDSSLASFAMEQYAATVQALKNFMEKAGRKFEEAFSFAKYAVPVAIGVAAIAAFFIVPKILRATPIGRLAIGSYSKKRRRGKKARKLSWWEPEMKLEGYRK
jgi:hypothetical protein